MKKNLLLLLLVMPALFLFSCKKEHSSTPKLSGKKYAVKFNVSNFDQQKGVFSVGHQGKLSVNALVDPKDYLDVLYYVVYDTDGRFSISTITQDSAQRDMGTIVDSLPNGTYPVYIFAGKKGLITNTLGFGPSATYGYGGYNWQDTFWAGFNFTVNNGNVTRNVTLARTVTKLELQVLDNIPANANSISMTIANDFLSQDVNFGMPDGGTSRDTSYVSVVIPAAAKGQPNFIVDKLIGGTGIFSIKIACRDASNHVIASTVVNDVECDVNKKTILSGDLFTTTPGGDSQTFQVKIDTAWSSTTNTVHF